MKGWLYRLFFSLPEGVSKGIVRPVTKTAPKNPPPKTKPVESATCKHLVSYWEGPPDLLQGGIYHTESCVLYRSHSGAHLIQPGHLAANSATSNTEKE